MSGHVTGAVKLAAPIEAHESHTLATRKVALLARVASSGPPTYDGSRRRMRTANYVFSVTSIVLGIALILFMFTQNPGWNIGVAIGVVLVLNGAVRLWFAQDDR